MAPEEWANECRLLGCRTLQANRKRATRVRAHQQEGISFSEPAKQTREHETSVWRQSPAAT